jgi:hypothetical protein
LELAWWDWPESKIKASLDLLNADDGLERLAEYGV